MNSESPFRISSMVLTVASILCGISAASYLAAQFAPRRNSFHQTTVAASALQVKLSEFQTNGGHSVAQSSHSMVASRTPLLSAPTNPPRASAPATLLKVPAATEQTDHKSRVMTAKDTVTFTTCQSSVVASPLLGPEGNREFFVHLAPGPGCAEIGERIAEVAAL